jgi:hypothetical protein
MLNRNQMISILSSMSDEKLVQAMSATGIDVGPSEGYDLGEEESAGLEPWNMRDVSVPAVVKPPLVDKSVFTRPATPMQARREYLSDETDLGGLGEYAAHQVHANQGGF